MYGADADKLDPGVVGTEEEGVSVLDETMS